MANGWKQLLAIACDMIDAVNTEYPIINSWTLGGGTALMLHIDHRDSHDIDIFLDDRQLLSYLDPDRQDFEFAITPSTYLGDGSGFQKIVFGGLGEIDFIVGAQLTNVPARKSVVDGREIMLETVEEIIAKKVFYRAANILPRDIFDIAAASLDHRQLLIVELSNHKSKVERALAQIAASERGFIDSAIDDLRIRPSFDDLRKDAVSIATELLSEALARSTPASET